MSLQVHILKRDSYDLDTVLPRIIALSNNIFNADPQTKYSSSPHWRSHLASETSTIVYLAPDDTASGNPVAFLFAHPRTHTPPLSDGTTDSLHIWLAGVLPEWRKMGCLQQMMKVLMSDPAPLYTICTIPARFPDMWAWLGRRGWLFERDLAGGRVMYSRRKEGVEVVA